jgi:hypothetical protein
VLCFITLRTFNQEKETYIYCQIGTNLLTSPSSDLHNPYEWSEIEGKRAAQYIYLLQFDGALESLV